jgi:hypothetical protein
LTAPAEGRSRAIPVTFVLGLLLGVAATLLLPPFVRPHLPAALGGGHVVVGGVVTAKRMEPDQLFLTLPTAQGTILASFAEDAERIAMMIGVGDSVTLQVRGYKPFIEDPRITFVMQRPGRAGGAGEAAAPDTQPPAVPAP